jgi:hypothetical protein
MLYSFSDETSESNFLALFAPLLQSFLNGTASSFMSFLLNSSTLHALVKGDISGVGLRPVAVGSTLFRLISKIALKSVSFDASLHLRVAGQLGVGVPGGCEAIIHAVNEYQNHRTQLPFDIKNSNPTAVLKIDFKNAFNLVSRAAIIDQLRLFFPKLLPWFLSSYGSASSLVLTDPFSPLQSTSGVRQGDPCSSLYFSLVLNPLLLRLRAHLPHMDLLAFFIDDGTLIASPTDLLTALNIIQEFGSTVGIHLNLSKCELGTLEFNSSISDPDIDLYMFPTSITRLSRDGLHLLGAAIGNRVFINSHLSECVVSINSSLHKLPLLHDAQMHYHFLKNCAGVSRFQYHLRTNHPEYISSSIQQFDEAVLNNVDALLGSPPGTVFSAPFLPRISVSGKDGGIGITLASDISFPAYIASVSSTSSLVCGLLGAVTFVLPIPSDGTPVLPIQPSAAAITTTIFNEVFSSRISTLLTEFNSAFSASFLPQELLIDPRKNQLTLTTSVRSHKFNTIMSSTLLSERDRCLLLCNRTLGSNDFLTISPTLGNETFFLPSHLFRILLLRRLGAYIFKTPDVSGDINNGSNANRSLNLPDVSGDIDNGSNAILSISLPSVSGDINNGSDAIRSLSLPDVSGDIINGSDVNRSLSLPQIFCPSCRLTGTPILLDPFGDHAAVCRGFLQRKHNTIRDTLGICFKDAGFTPVFEANGLIPNSGRRPGDLYIPFYSNQYPLAVDTAGVSSMRGYIGNTNFSPMENITSQSALKIAQSADVLLARGIKFSPFVCGSLGGFDTYAENIMSFLDSRILERRMNGTFLSRLSVRNRISAAIAKVSASVLFEIGSKAKVLS